MSKVLIFGSLAASLHNFRGALIMEMLARGHVVHAAALGLLADTLTYTRLQALGVQFG